MSGYRRDGRVHEALLRFSDRRNRFCVLVGSLTINQHEVSNVHQCSNSLSGDKDRITPVNRVGQCNQPSNQAQIPEGDWHPAFGFSLRDDPLNEPSTEKQPLPEETNGKPEDFN